jgi:23S rRNA pseudouridine2605 synthase
MTEERVQKIMARAGYGSRRACETLISAGRVTIDGKRAALGTKADPALNTIVVDGQQLSKAEPLVYIALHKPRGVLSDIDPQDTRQTVRDLVPVPGHLFSVGRLDMDSEGLILLTNDGILANRLTHPRYGHEKEYKVLVAIHPDQQQLETWRRGVVLEDGHRTMPAQVLPDTTLGKGTWLRVILKEGRKRQIREVGKQLSIPIVRIVRVRIGSLLLGNLKPRDWRYLTPQEVRALSSATALPKATPARRSPAGHNRPQTSRTAEKTGRTKTTNPSSAITGRDRTTFRERKSPVPDQLHIPLENKRIRTPSKRK